MKNILSILLFFCTALCLHAETANTDESYPIIDVITYDAATQTDLVYSNDFNNFGYDHLTTSFPIADHLYISGTHIEFTLSRETIEFRYLRNKNESVTTLDLDIHFFNQGSSLDSSTKIIRIKFIH